MRPAAAVTTNAMWLYGRDTRIKFVPRTTEKDYIRTRGELSQQKPSDKFTLEEINATMHKLDNWTSTNIVENDVDVADKNSSTSPENPAENVLFISPLALEPDNDNENCLIIREINLTNRDQFLKDNVITEVVNKKKRGRKSLEKIETKIRASNSKHTPQIITNNKATVDPTRSWCSVTAGNIPMTATENLPSAGDFAGLMGLISEIQKIFSGIKDIKELTRKLQNTETIVDKLMYLGEDSEVLLLPQCDSSHRAGDFFLECKWSAR
ncbi:unnamed protein product [Larinioides sclopetarius]|uniref:Uncharacterized protein n=1 Tax=Larinioides sclopetarius TaxID=280406 RepID=A0AAV1ZZJ0_9ARAC